MPKIYGPWYQKTFVCHWVVSSSISFQQDSCGIARLSGRMARKRCNWELTAPVVSLSAVEFAKSQKPDGNRSALPKNSWWGGSHFRQVVGYLGTCMESSHVGRLPPRESFSIGFLFDFHFSIGIMGFLYVSSWCWGHEHFVNVSKCHLTPPHPAHAPTSLWYCTLFFPLFWPPWQRCCISIRAVLGLCWHGVFAMVWPSAAWVGTKLWKEDHSLLPEAFIGNFLCLGYLVY